MLIFNSFKNNVNTFRSKIYFKGKAWMSNDLKGWVQRNIVAYAYPFYFVTVV